MSEPGGEGERRRGSTGEKRWVRGGEVKKEGLSVGGFFFHFSSSFSLVAVHHVTMCNWPVVTPELCKQISRETCQPEAAEVNVCVV